MNKSIFLCIICVISFVAPISAQLRPGNVGFDYSEFNIFKQQKVKTQTQIVLDEDSITTLLSVSEYSPDGWLIRTTFSNGDGYDEEMEMDTMKDEFTYFPDGKIKLIALYGYDLFPITQGFEYDNKNILIKSIIASAEAREYSYTYDKKGNIIERAGKSARFEVDDEGNSLDKMIMVPTDVTTYTWDEKNRLIGEEFNMGDEFYNRMNYVYNDKNQLVEMRVYYDLTLGSEPDYITRYYYLENGLPNKVVTVEGDFKLENYYEYTFY